ncbi:MAG: TIGR04211 family SH3 domain-containing protein [Gammaproteobacteria bacterium]|uniref:TIGR04211 family SH3 domain-containing protein n=1 Tax=Pseudomaricurvus alcaniphilus TaxID=1166482 RepID=UPI00140D8A71|nr:TIGR04211 family SH3 domain-containing protein [Gammaproteobacteria bacterium]NHN37470.1 TIGR04211 family SH3 domain-containing protein [Pseudomaricurvus alcaniphilus]
MKIFPVLFALTILLGFAQTGLAEQKVWVADSMYLPLRSGEGNQYRIIANLKTGTSLTLLSPDPNSEWVEVRTNGGTTGFVLSQHLRDTPIAAEQLEAARKELAALRSDYAALKLQLQQYKGEGNELSQALQKSEQQASTLQQEYDELKRISESAVNLHQRHKEMLHNYDLLKTELDVLKARNARLQSDARNTFFLYGAGAVLLGVLIALTAPHLRRRKRFSEWAN